MNPTVVLADDHKMFRDGLRLLLRDRCGLDVVAECEDGPSTVEAVAKHLPDLVIMDISMPGLNGIDATRRILAEVEPAPRIIALTMHSDSRFVLEMLKAGASGYLLKDSSFDELADAIAGVLRGEMRLGRQINDTVVQGYVELARSRDSSAFSRLSPREREVLQLLAEGKSTKEMADDLCVSIKTIETHRRQIMDKLDLHSVAELTKYAVREGLTPLD